MFKFDSQSCLLFKQALQILKTEVVSIRAKGNAALFSFHNRNTGLLLLHRVKAEVTREQEFGINSERLVALLQKNMLELDYNGSSVSYKSGRSHGTLETHKPVFEPWPNLKETGVSVQEVLEEFSFLNLKSKNDEIYIFGGTYENQDYVAAGDREHAVTMPLQKVPPFALPLSALSGAQRIFKGKVNVVVDAGTIFFTSQSETSQSVLRFGQLGNTEPLSLNTFGKFKSLPPIWSSQIDMTSLGNMIQDCEAIKDAERTSLLNLKIEPDAIHLSSKTRHGEAHASEKAQGDSADVVLNLELLKDIAKLEGSVRIGVKEGGRIFFIENSKCSYFCALAA